MEAAATRMCELLVGLGDVDVLGVDDTNAEFVEVTVRARTSRVFCHSCGVLAGLKEWQPTQLVDLGCFGRPAPLCWRKRRWRCNQAGSVSGRGLRSTTTLRRLVSGSPAGPACGHVARSANTAGPSPKTPENCKENQP